MLMEEQRQEYIKIISFLPKQRWIRSFPHLRQLLALCVVTVKSILILASCFPHPGFWKPQGSSLTGLVWQARNFQSGHEHVGAFQTQSPLSIWHISNGEKDAACLKKRTAALKKCRGISVHEFLVKKFSSSKLKSAADAYCLKGLSNQKLAGLQLRWLVLSW